MCGRLAKMSAPAYSSRPIPAALYASASARYQKFCAEMRTIDGAASIAELGKVIVKPSCIWAAIENFDRLGQILDAPIIDNSTGEVIALSMNWDESPITEAQWAREVAEAAAKLEAKHAKWAELCDTANAEIKALCEAGGFSVVEFYEEFNRRAAALM